MDAADVIRSLDRAGRTLAVAESFTGGRLLDALTDVAGSSKVLRGGIVAYSDDAKRELLGVSAGDLVRHGAVSGPVASAMAEGVRRRFHADVGVATTGIAGPGGATRAKPVGLSFIAAVGPTQRVEVCARHPGERDEVKRAARDHAWTTLADLLRREGIL